MGGGPEQVGGMWTEGTLQEASRTTPPVSRLSSVCEVPIPLQKGAECGEGNSTKAGRPNIQEPLSASHCSSSYFNC